MHPFVPFITEGIFQKLNEIAPDRKLEGLAEPNTAEVLAVSGWAGLDKSLQNEEVERAIEDIQLVIKTLRDIRNKYGISPKDKMTASSNAPDSVAKILNENSQLICQLANLEKFEAGSDMEKPKKAAASVAGELQVYLHDAIDPQAEIERLNKQKEKILKGKKSAEGKLSNENFLNKAKPEIVERTKEQLEQFNRQLENVEGLLSELQQD
jgi:valyl-tRNA synthetase